MFRLLHDLLPPMLDPSEDVSRTGGLNLGLTLGGMMRQGLHLQGWAMRQWLHLLPQVIPLVPL